MMLCAIIVRRPVGGVGSTQSRILSLAIVQMGTPIRSSVDHRVSIHFNLLLLSPINMYNLEKKKILGSSCFWLHLDCLSLCIMVVVRFWDSRESN